ncbi:MAG: hypothetical protein IJF65_02645 [Clostridia bacterium]|nr:hypothetical protein [Clostridia bacterium]
MPLVCYCKKCKIEVPVGETCSLCGGKLTKASARFSFAIQQHPVKDWMRWNGLLRLVLIVWILLVLAISAVEYASAGSIGVSRLLRGSSGLTLLLILGITLLLVFLWLIGIGKETHYCFLDQKGVHVSCYVAQPSRMNRLLRFKSGSTHSDVYGLFAGQVQIQWTQIRRVQIWHDKKRILLYAPRWWLQLAITCPPDQFEGAIGFLKGKLGRRKDVVIQETPQSDAAESVDA